MNRFNGLSISSVRIFTKQILHALDALSKVNIIHCDLKPENILLVNNSIQLKVIDFGSACLESQRIYTYIQSRFYRASEIILGSDYTSAIDIWSLACISFELFYGLPLFPGKSEYEMLKRMINVLGSEPPQEVLQEGKNSLKYFTCERQSPLKFGFLKSEEEFCSQTQVTLSPYRDYFNGDTTLEEIVMNYPMDPQSGYKEIEDRKSLLHMLRLMLRWDSKKRYRPASLLQHPFISGDSLDTFVEMETETKERRKRSFSFGFSTDVPPSEHSFNSINSDPIEEDDGPSHYLSLPQQDFTLDTEEMLGSSPFYWGY
jgi:dual specificity protein kinase YAK1